MAGLEELFHNHFGSQYKSMNQSIGSTLKKETAYSCALLLSIYTEIFGGLVTGNLKDSNAMRPNYVKFLEYLGSGYIDLHNKYDLYKNVRNKLVHEFSPRPSYGIWITDVTSEDRLGIEILDGHLNFHLREYFRDFQNGVKKYLDEWNSNAMHIINFQKAMSIDWQNVGLKEIS